MNCKPGDLAIVIGECDTPGIRGRIVEVIRFVVGQWFNGINYQPVDGDCWEIRAAGGGDLPAIYNDGVVRMKRTRLFSDSNLRPISGVPIHDEEHNEVTA